MTDQHAVEIFLNGGIIAYPTEAVFGLGCDPDNEQALQRLLALKQRPAEKGLILLASDFEQLLPYIDLSGVSAAMQQQILERWPDGITQVVQKNHEISPLLSGKFASIAVRLTSQPDVVALCRAVNRPIVSTSANLTGLPPADSWQSLDPQLVEQVDCVIKGKTLGFDKPSTIIDAITGEEFRS
ncbi:Sua5/YciO/YrdC/YwlC family protein [Psychrobium sp. 1_MG-2023]|uniref:Sua5/YciO/YrdC/YwlC family protein n=1 Tax=Psychrobium sp. 1_MG-2023 TaxID=3062624 RepID=UPI000C32037A|nr:Sua5/YciO/YrdC/YwlC family protein [Psychrobium sp. 1_MG-2023]MDP2561099.1 Sua5/YciO/YrdC/YwlC family protein [Psychrobium sp. 1_MG-2023]PKF58387.1 L-threonylcarbamoyladenylate synthase type 1 TsaC [Alteromonadales bacterium alter-6D02]